MLVFGVLCCVGYLSMRKCGAVVLMTSISTEERRLCQAKKPFNCLTVVCLGSRTLMSTPTAKTTQLCSGDSVVPRPSENVRPWLQGNCPVDVGVFFEKAVLNFFGSALRSGGLVY